MYASVDNEPCGPEHLKCVSPEPTNMCVQTTFGFIIKEFQPFEVFAESVSSLIIKVIHEDGT